VDAPPEPRRADQELSSLSHDPLRKQAAGCRACRRQESIPHFSAHSPPGACALLLPHHLSRNPRKNVRSPVKNSALIKKNKKILKKV
jgi:hypothetical protein